MIGSIEAFDVSNHRTALLHRRLLAVQILGEGHIRPVEVLQLLQRLKDRSYLAAAVAQSAILKADLRAIAFVSLQSRLIDQRPQLRWPAVDELSAQLDRLIAHMPRPDAPANAVLCFHHQHLQPSLGQRPRRSQPRHACANYDDIMSVIRHEPLDARSVCLASTVALAPRSIGIERLLRPRAVPRISVAPLQRQLAHVIMNRLVAIATDAAPCADAVVTRPDRPCAGLRFKA